MLDESKEFVCYDEYIKSQAWDEKRKKRIAMDGGRCSICGSTEHLHVHHISYKKLGNENVEKDIVTLCRNCHMKLHRCKEEYDKVADTAKQDLVLRVVNGDCLRGPIAEYQIQTSEALAKIIDSFCKRRSKGVRADFIYRLVLEVIGDIEGPFEVLSKRTCVNGDWLHYVRMLGKRRQKKDPKSRDEFESRTRRLPLQISPLYDPESPKSIPGETFEESSSRWHRYYESRRSW